MRALGRLPIRVRLTAAFALAMAAVLTLTCVFVYLRLRSDLDEGVDNGVHARADDVAALVERSGPRLAPSTGGGALDPEDSFAQLLSPDGRVLDTSGGARTAALTPAQARDAARRATTTERRVPGIDGTARMRARPATAGGRTVVVVTGASLEERDETLGALVGSFALGGPAAILLASLLGYLLAGAGLRPVEAMRRRAERVSMSRAGERLPLPVPDDEVRRLAETLNEMLARLEASFERERRFVADAGHELRTPLAVLKTELETLMRAEAPGTGAAAAAERRESLAAALAEADHLAQLADDLLLVARAGDTGLPTRPESVEVRRLLEDARDRFTDRARQEGRAIAVDVPDGLRAELDPLRARQALGNLVDNALRHGRGEVRLSARADGDTLAIEVDDDGPGFPPELAERAFERFARGDEARTRGGAGLGLSIVRLIAEAHGGTAAIVDAEGRRGVVRLTVPLSPNAHPGGRRSGHEHT